MNRVVGIDGSVRDCRVLRGLPHMDLAAVRALEGRCCTPALLAGRPLAIHHTSRLQLSR